MKAAVLFGNEDIRYADWEEPEVGPGDVKIRIQVTGICGSDVPRVLHNGAHFYPVVLGHEFSGDIVEIGEGVTRFQIGERVTGAPLLPCHQCPDCLTGHYSQCKNYSFVGSRQQGSFAQYVVIPQQNVVPFDDSVSYEQGAMIEPATVALHGLRCIHYCGGKDVAVLGGGTIGLFTMQWAKIFGAKSVTVFDLVDERLALAKKLGAEYTVNPLSDKLPDGFGYVFETAGSPKTMQTAFEIAGNQSGVCFIGTPHTDLTFTPKLWENMNRKEFTLTGSWMSYSSPFPGEEWDLAAHYFATKQLKFDPGLIDSIYPMQEAAQAFERYKTPGSVKGRIMLKNVF